MLSNPKTVKDRIVDWIREYFVENGQHCTAIIGISGGKDSTIAAALCVEALGPARVLGVMMPDGEQDADSKKVVELLNIPNITVQVGTSVTALMHSVDDTLGEVSNGTLRLSEQAKINMPPRIRMATLYAVAQSLLGGGRVVNTCNYSEDYVGYSTKYGDSAGDFSPLADLTVAEVKQIGYELGLPADLVDKTPADGLCGKTDEDNLGFTYEKLDAYIDHGTCGDIYDDMKIARLHKRGLHKLKPMPTFRLREVHAI